MLLFHIVVLSSPTTFYHQNNKCVYLSIQWVSSDICCHEIGIYWHTLNPHVLNAIPDVYLSHTALSSGLPAAPTDWHWGVQTWRCCPMCAHGIPEAPVHTKKPLKKQQLNQGVEGCYEPETEHRLTRTHTAAYILYTHAIIHTCKYTF